MQCARSTFRASQKLTLTERTRTTMAIAKLLYSDAQTGVASGEENSQSERGPRSVEAHPCPDAVPRRSTVRTSSVVFESHIVKTVHVYASLYHLSAQEERLLACSLHGIPDKIAADELGCSRNTVGTYWKRIFVKTGHRPQREVIAHVFRSTLLTRSG